MSTYILGFPEIDQRKLIAVGGKGANLGELRRIKGICVPDGFCVTTEAFTRATGNNQPLDRLMDQLMGLTVADRESISELSAKIRTVIESISIPQDIVQEIAAGLAKFEREQAFAIRSSATAEDLPTASFAGQQDSYLNIIGKDATLKHISKCWASLFTDRAILYRLQNGFDHRKIRLAVIVQKMVFPQVAGVLFTADPLSSNRKVLSIDAGVGLAEALVSGRVNPDGYRLRNGKVIGKRISTNRQVLKDDQMLQLEQIGRIIETHFGRPQDIEWCLADEQFYIVQSRPITTLFPIPVANDRENHVYVSVGHQQMMTDAMKPLGLSIWQLTAFRPMHTAGGRLFVDVTPDLASPAKREILVNVLGKSDPLIRDALLTILGWEDFIRSIPEEEEGSDAKRSKAMDHPDFRTLKDYDPSVVPDLIRRFQTAIVELKQDIRTKSGTRLLDFILTDLQKLKKDLADPQSFGVIMTAMNASSWINEKMNDWLGEKNAADTLSQSVPNNITSEMGLDLLNVADVIRPYPEIANYLQRIRGDDFLDSLDRLDGGGEVRNAILAYLEKYGMRCAGEIDITRTRWSEKPSALVPLILNNIKSFEPNAGSRKFEQGRQDAQEKQLELLARVAQLPDGEQKAQEAGRMIELVRSLIGYREYPKYHIVSRYFVYKQALLEEAGMLVQSGVIHEREDIYFLSLEELRETIRTRQIDHSIIDKRKDDFKVAEKLTPPRVITSDGEIVRGRYGRKNLPEGAIAGLPVSAGVVEGRARIISTLEDARLEKGDILVTSFTDPSWTPLFISIKGLVTEVGGLMTHGAVIAREYGLPAVVGVENAMRRIRDGQQIRVNGTEGFVEILHPESY